jgi:hypothetical protein
MRARRQRNSFSELVSSTSFKAKYQTLTWDELHVTTSTCACSLPPHTTRSPVTEDGRRLVQFLKLLDFFIGQFDIDRIC